MPARAPLALTRRRWLAASSAALLGSVCEKHSALLAQATSASARPELIDIHQHTNYHGRSDADLIKHQEAMGVTKTILLPAGSDALRPSTHNGKSFGLAARVLGNEAAYRLVKEYPDKFVFCANEVTDLENAIPVMEKYLKLGACGIGEQKFSVECDSAESLKMYDLAKAYGVPVLLHFQYKTYNLGYERFYQVLEKYPTVNFIAHAQTTWGNVDAAHKQENLYPTGKVTPGGLTDKWLTNYPNFFADLSAGSGLNAFTRDEEHGAAFFMRHQDKLLYGSDCQDALGVPEEKNCCGSKMIALIRKLVPDEGARQKIFSGNTKRVFKLA
ncbi:amidohydrolase family protein [Roseimicrobium sp. ORNL1]|uniref:amidohydrolase family protein n=1 Tax=Roseimicrobium sp. ORNL1 TaxID=2711231 RepID=UPI0013E1AB5D|nr:amidohydrolase family protein [Roseimicrobium sp. ORNL1]QIF05696.1 amidohydrolase family protein [Roseimicrobium sp. ORNL1]